MANLWKGRRGVWIWVGRLVQLALGAFIALHVYALALRFLPTPPTLTMVERVMSGMDVRRNPTALTEISPHLVRAVIAAEDSRFCQHEGIDIEAVRDALEERERSGRVRGASTITQQTAKNVFLWNGGGYVRKAPEAWLALFIDNAWGKRRVMEVYLNIAEWGDGLFGAEAAARVRFNKHARDLTEYEAALLAAVLPSPNKWKVRPAGPYVQNRARTLVARMRDIERSGLAHCVLAPD